VSQLDALPKEAEKKAKLAFMWFFVCAMIFIAAGGYLLFVWNDAIKNNRPGNLDALIGFGGVMLTFGILSIILAIILKIKVLGGMKDDKWDTAVDMSLLIGIPGFMFGMGLSGMWLYWINKKMRDHPYYLKTLPPPTPVCERCRQPVTFNAQQQKWYCPNCKIYL